jgi:hypothetical protein
VTGAALSVTGTTGPLIPGPQTSVQNPAIGVTQELIRDSAGFYSAPNLLAGTYEFAISAQGFRTAMESNITLGLVASGVRALPREAKLTETV